MIFPLRKRIECYKRVLVTRLCHKNMFTIGTEILIDPIQLTKTSTKSRKSCLEIRLTIRELVDIAGISFGSVQTILKGHLGLRRVKSRLMLKFLNFFEKSVAFKHVKQCFLTIKAMNLRFKLAIHKQLTNQVNIV